MALRPPATGGASSPDTFSTNEVLTNKVWVDGKPIYRKVVNCGALPNNATKAVPHGLSGVNVIWVGGSALGVSLPFAASTAAETIMVWVDSTNINLRTGMDRTAYNPAYVTFEYTK